MNPNNEKARFFMKKLLRNFIFDIILAVILLIIGIVMLPPITLGGKILPVLIGLATVAYLVFYIGRKLEKARGIYFVALILEIILGVVLAEGLVLQQFRVFEIGSACQYVGVLLWARGTVALFGERFYPKKTEKKYSIALFIVYVLLLSFGLWIFKDPFIDDLALLWIFCIACFVTSAILGFLAYIVAPKSGKQNG
jgi:uncharacterized membrane protein HdeD (DUF308 family)